MTLNGIPLHPLVVHAAVVFAPMAALSAILFAVVPRWRWALRWPTLVLAIAAAGSVQFAAMTGGSLKHQLGLQGTLIHNHEMWAGRLQFVSWVLAAVVLAAWWVFPAVTPLAGRPNRASRLSVLVKPLIVSLPVLAAVALVLVYLTGDAGAKAVWAANAQ
jgi:hypothetical protein